MKKISVLLFICYGLIFPQGGKNQPVIPFHNKIPFYAEVHVIPVDSLNKISYIFKIPYDQLVFEKDGIVYNAGIILSVEVYDTSGNFISRQIKNKELKVEDFDETKSSKLFLQGMVEFLLPNNNYNLNPHVTDVNSNQQVKLNQYLVKKINHNFLDFMLPIVVDENKKDIDGKLYTVLTNYEGFIPLDNNKYQIIFPSADTSIENIYVTLVNNKDTVFTGNVSESIKGSNSFIEKDGYIVLTSDENIPVFRYFILENIGNKMTEGELKIIVAKNKTAKYSEEYNKQVVWFDKPFSLRDSEFAIKALKYIEPDSVVNKILDVSKAVYGRELYKYWEKFDPTPGTAYNELMNEYYRRVDYAILKFAPISGKNGAETDRGNIFIKFGKPGKIERNSDDQGRIIETWIYYKQNFTFRFIDKNGNGEFPLVKG